MRAFHAVLGRTKPEMLGKTKGEKTKTEKYTTSDCNTYDAVRAATFVIGRVSRAVLVAL